MDATDVNVPGAGNAATDDTADAAPVDATKLVADVAGGNGAGAGAGAVTTADVGACVTVTGATIVIAGGGRRSC
jgi:hypothetical protein